MSEGYTWRCEHEFADTNIRNPLPKGWSRGSECMAIVNSTGIANDPSGKLHHFGGEVNSPPTDTAFGQARLLQAFVEHAPDAKVNYRSNLRIHVKVPGLREDLRRLKRWARFNEYWIPRALPALMPVPEPRREDYEEGAGFVYRGALRHARRCRRLCRFRLTAHRLERQLHATTPEEFFLNEVSLNGSGKPMWFIQPRAAVNLRQLLWTDTVEFRHFPGTLDWRELADAMRWCEIYTAAAMSEWDEPVQAGNLAFIAGKIAPKLPRFKGYDHALEIRYRATCRDNTIGRRGIARNIAAIEAGTFDDATWEAWFEKRFKW